MIDRDNLLLSDPKYDPWKARFTLINRNVGKPSLDIREILVHWLNSWSGWTTGEVDKKFWELVIDDVPGILKSVFLISLMMRLNTL